MTIDYTLTPDELSTAVYNTILIFDEYQLRKKADHEGHQYIIDTSWKGMFTYFISETMDGSRLTLNAVSSKSSSDDELSGHEEKFLKNLYKVIDKEISITPDKANKSIYKDRKMRVGFWTVLWIVLIIVLVLKTIQGFMKS